MPCGFPRAASLTEVSGRAESALSSSTECSDLVSPVQPRAVFATQAWFC